MLAVFRGKVLIDLRMALFNHIQRATLSYFQTTETGYLMSRLTDDVYAAQGFLAQALVSGIQNILLFIAGTIAIIYIHPKLAFICLLLLPLYLLSLIVFNKKIRGLSKVARERYAIVQRNLQELLSGIYIIKIFTKEKHSQLKLYSSIKSAFTNEIQLEITASLAGLCSMIISSLGPLLIIWYGCGEIMRGNLTVGGLLAFTSFTGYLFGPVRTLYDLNLGIQRSLPAVDRIFEILSVETEKDGKESLHITKGDISFKNVCFKYDTSHDDNNYVINSLNLDIPSGKTYAIVGHSGAGKTTLASFLLRLYLPQKGKILIDGQDISDVKLKSLRNNIGLVPQDTFLFSDTIRENIKLGKPLATDEEVETAARAAHAHDFIMQMPGGYDTKVGERGVTLSGGQRQRVAIARALIINPRILILDEATSQIDTQSENEIQKALDNISIGKTVLVIAHRLTTVKKADKIAVLEKGRIVAQGTHEELFKNSASYRELYHLLESAPNQLDNSIKNAL